MTNKYFGGLVENTKVSGEFDDELIQLAIETPKIVEQKMNDLRVSDAISAIFDLLRRCNKYVDETTVSGETYSYRITSHFEDGQYKYPY